MTDETQPLDPNKALAPTTPQETSVVAWEGAAALGLKAKKERDAIIADVLKEGADFGNIPGVDKPVLLQSGMQKIMDCLGLYADYEQLPGTVEDWDKPLFNYVFRCTIRQRGTNYVVSTGIGSCNSMENRYRWRKTEYVCPECGKQAVIKGKKEYGGGWLCWEKRGGCGTKWKDDHEVAKELAAKPDKVPNDDIYTQVNTMVKMAQKRATGKAVNDLGFAEQYTVDVEDNPESFRGGKKTTTKKRTSKKASPKTPQEVPNPWTGKMLEPPDVINSKDGSWTAYVFKCEGGAEFGTYDESIAEQADAIRSDGLAMQIEWKVTKKGRRNAVKITRVSTEAGEVGSDAPLFDDDRPPIDSDDE